MIASDTWLPLFPLNAVLFPQGVLPLKVFEARYTDMVRDCMKRLAPQVELPESILKRARLPIERMLEISARPIENAG